MSDQIDDQNSKETLIAIATFGRQVEEFWNSDVGKFLLKKINKDIMSAFEELKSCDPKDGKLVQTLQNKIYRAESVQEWLGTAIVQGLQALSELDER